MEAAPRIGAPGVHTLAQTHTVSYCPLLCILLIPLEPKYKPLRCSSSISFLIFVSKLNA